MSAIRTTQPGLNPKGWTRVPNSLLLDARTLGLTDAAVVVMVWLLAHRNQKTGLAWPSQDSIAEASGLGLSTVRMAVVKLREAGLLDAVRRRHDGQTRLVYTFPTIDHCAASGATPIAQPAAQDSPTVAQNNTDRCAASGASPIRKNNYVPIFKNTDFHLKTPPNPLRAVPIQDLEAFPTNIAVSVVLHQ